MADSEEVSTRGFPFDNPKHRKKVSCPACQQPPAEVAESKTKRSQFCFLCSDILLADEDCFIPIVHPACYWRHRKRKQPPASEFTMKYAKEDLAILLEKACDRLDAQQQQIKELGKIADSWKKTAEDFESQLADKQK